MGPMWSSHVSLSLSLSPSASTPIHQPPAPPQTNTTLSSTSSSPPATVILTILLLSLFFLGFFAIYFCRCITETIINSLHSRRNGPGGSGAAVGTPVVSPLAPEVPQGLEQSIIDTFPTFAYSSVKTYCKSSCGSSSSSNSNSHSNSNENNKYGLECAICLCEFEDNDVLRLLTACCHVFHRDCIDLWLGSNTSCPVCRQGLDTSKEKSLEKPVVVEAADQHELELEPEPEPYPPSPSPLRWDTSNSTTVDIVVINKDQYDHDHIDHDDHDNKEDEDKKEAKEAAAANETTTSTNDQYRFSRSHSTGHSMKDHYDKYTLRLPEDVKETITRRHMQTLSCTTFGDIQHFDQHQGHATTTKPGTVQKAQHNNLNYRPTWFGGISGINNNPT